MYRGVALFLIFLSAQTGFPQRDASLPKAAAAVKSKAATLSPNARVSVVRGRNDEEEFGNFLSSNQDGFTFYDIDRKAAVTLRYEEVRKLKDGYGGYNFVHKRHTDRTKGIVIALVVAGGLVALIAAAALAK